jgi:hypothetical protein
MNCRQNVGALGMPLQRASICAERRAARLDREKVAYCVIISMPLGSSSRR